MVDRGFVFRVDGKTHFCVMIFVMQITPLERAVEHFGNMSRLAAAIDYSQHAVWCAVKRRRVSPAMAAAIHKASRGKIKRADLRPDIFGGE
jgi:DNA-binding transcriptional regulator YdaS (Cro superfamily)